MEEMTDAEREEEEGALRMRGERRESLHVYLFTEVGTTLGSWIVRASVHLRVWRYLMLCVRILSRILYTIHCVECGGQRETDCSVTERDPSLWRGVELDVRVEPWSPEAPHESARGARRRIFNNTSRVLPAVSCRLVVLIRFVRVTRLAIASLCERPD